MPYQKVFKHVLIIDDDYTSRYLAKSLLEDLAISREILTANDGKQGLDKIKERCLNDLTAEGNCPDLILLDINMPVMNGFEVVEELHKLGKASLIEARIIVLTSSTNTHDKNKMLGFGVKGYLEKPISEDNLLPLLQAM